MRAALNEEVQKKNNLEVIFSLASYEYDYNYPSFKDELNLEIFDNIDILIIELNKYQNNSSSERIIKYCENKNIKIIKTCLITFPIFPINWSGYGDNKKDYLDWKGLENIDYKIKFKNIIDSLNLKFKETDLDQTIVQFIEENFSKQKLFTHSLHPTNILLYKLWESIFKNLNIYINDYKYNFNKEIIFCWENPFTTKMVNDLEIKFKVNINDKFYLRRFNKNKIYYLV